MILLLFAILVSPIREVTGPGIVNDVQSHLPKGHGYNCNNPISTVHECTHGINARLTNLYKKPCFYVLNNKAFIVESEMTLKQVADAIPKRFRGENYNFYLVQLQKYWNSELGIWEDREGTLVLDELSAYLNALEAREELGVTNRKEISGYVSEFIVYSSYVKGSKNYLDYQIKRAVKLGVKKGYHVPKRSESLVY